MQHLLNLSNNDLLAWLKERKHPTFRASQIWQWIFQKRVASFQEMENLPKQLRQDLTESFTIWSTTIAKKTVATDQTQKLLLTHHDGGQTESVLLFEKNRRTICVSSQVGCAMGCLFCASGLDGVDRNLTQGEILEQMLLLQRLLPDDERLSHIVMMGMGEPLANLSHVLGALTVANDPDRLGIGTRRITISTVGIPASIVKMADYPLAFQLAVSLHAPNEALRDRLVPVNKNIGLSKILAAVDQYYEKTRRQITFEYVLLSDINDHTSHAKELVSILRPRNAMLNVIPYNPVAGLPYQSPSKQRLAHFKGILTEAGITLKVRHRKGDEINAACGQLRRNNAQTQKKELYSIEGEKSPERKSP
ncbi:MAG: 23S rRNA (adenine(2503)-C(2))-methyltransferase RlmN [Pirellulaceae bacterium]|nr:23S rRNA (adenine(2503)-C(2))-methyltransferase RlmN [Pirellulaceae bacterium]